MKIIFVSDTLCHHQLALCDELYKLDADFEFVETVKRDFERISLKMEGFDRPYCVVFKNTQTIKQKIKQADIIIAGSVSARLLLNAKKGTKIFKYSERLFKKKKNEQTIKEKIQRVAQNALYRYIGSRNELFLLSASAYAPYDFLKCKTIKQKNMYKFGYFPGLKYNVCPQQNEKTMEIVWCNRVIDWKHPELVIELAKMIKKEHLDCHINMIGGGDLLETIKTKISDLNLDNVVSVIGPVQADKVNDYLRKSEISIYTSDRNEGWGVGVNESMASGCITIASNEMGSVPYLIRDGFNGMIFNITDIDSFLKACRYAIKNVKCLWPLRLQAVETISKLWSPNIAATRLYNLVTKGDVANDDGPCSKAPIISDC